MTDPQVPKGARLTEIPKTAYEAMVNLVTVCINGVEQGGQP